MTRSRASAPDAVIYSTITAALLAPAPGAIRFDALGAANRPGRHGVWQRPRERRRARARAAAAAGQRAGAGRRAAPASAACSSCRSPSSPPGRRCTAAAARHRRDHLRGRTRTRRASTACSRPGRAARRDGEELLVAGVETRSAARRRRARARHARPRRLPRAAAPRAHLHRRVAARGVRDRPARGARRRRDARQQPRPRRATRRSSSRARSTRGWSAPISPPRSAPRSTIRARLRRGGRAAARALLARERRPRRRRAAAAGAQRRPLEPSPRAPPRAACWRRRPPSARRAAPSRCRSAARRSRCGECASELITMPTPAAAAARACTSLRSRRSGLALISSSVPLPRAGGEHRVDVERVGLRAARSAGRSGGRAHRRADGRAAASTRSVIASRVERERRVHAGDHPVELRRAARPRSRASRRAGC